MKGKTKKWWREISTWLVVFSVALLVGVGTWIGLNKSGAMKRKYSDRGVPVMEISLNGVSLDEIDSGSKETKYEGNEVKIYNNDEISEYAGMEIKGRGNGTWIREKKPYQIKFEKKVNLFGMGKARKWYLLANKMDDTNLRTEAAFYLESMIGMKHTFEGQFVELYVDGDYRGLYYLTHAVEISKQVVDLRDPLGILVELDNIYGGLEENYKTNNGDLLVIKDVVNKDNKDVAMENFLQSYNELEAAVNEGDYEKALKVADMESFAQYFLLSEFMVNPDAYWTSFYVYKDGVGDKIHAGPAWDFDLTFGNRRWGNWMGERFYSTDETMIRRSEILPKEYYDDLGIEGGYEASLQLSKLMFNMMEMSEFREEVARIYNAKISGRINEFINMIRRETKLIGNAARTNNERWEMYDFDEEIGKMVEWIEGRYRYFEREYGDGGERVEIN